MEGSSKTAYWYVDRSNLAFVVYSFALLATMIPTTYRTSPIPGGENVEMPFVGRQAAVDRMWMWVVERAQKEASTTDRMYHPHFFAAGTPGIGKTRLGLEIPNLLAQRAAEVLQQEQQPETIKKKAQFILNSLTTNKLTVMISFLNVFKPDGRDFDGKWSTDQDKVNWILTSRAIYIMFDIDIPWRAWATELRKLLGDDLPEQLSFRHFLDQLIAARKPTALHFHMDEFQNILQMPIAIEILREFSLQYSRLNSANLLTLIVYSGTVYNEVTKLFADGQWGNSSEFPPVPLPLENLAEDLVYKLLDDMQAANLLPWLPADWKQQAPYRKLFAYASGVPRLLEMIIQFGKSSRSLDELAHTVLVAVKQRYNFDPKVLETSCMIALSTKRFQLDNAPKTLPNHTIEQLCAKGAIYYNLDTNQLSVPYLYFRLATDLPDVSLMPATELPEMQIRVSEYLTKLGAPCSTLKWSEFEQVNLIYDIMKVYALKALGHQTCSIREYFSHATICSTSLHNVEFELKDRQYMELAERWPDTNLDWPKAKIEKTFIIEEHNIFDYVYLNASGSSMDGFLFAKAVDGKTLVFVYQCKHTVGKVQLTAQAVEDEVTKMKVWFEAWLTGVKPQKAEKTKEGAVKTKARAKAFEAKYQKLMMAHAGLKALKEQKPILIPVIFTNRKMSNSEQTSLVSFSKQTNLIVIDNPAYFGPWKHMLQFFGDSKDK